DRGDGLRLGPAVEGLGQGRAAGPRVSVPAPMKRHLTDASRGRTCLGVVLLGSETMLLDSDARPAASWPGLQTPRIRVSRIVLALGLFSWTLLADLARAGVEPPPRKTEVSIRGD